MKKIILLWFSTLLVNMINAQDGSCLKDEEYFGTSYSKGNRVQAELNQLVKRGVPGVSMAVYSDEGWWTGVAGYSRLETKESMEFCNLLYLQSVSKTFMSVAVLKLFEDGKIDLDKPIASYLPASTINYITGAEKISVRMLLNHTSGIPEYNSLPVYITKLLQEPSHQFEPIDYLKYIEGKPLDFEPGSRYSYRNTNYVALALIVDSITGDHARFISEHIFKTLNLTHTYYRSEPGYLNYPALVNSYWDRHSDGILENASVLQQNNVKLLVGDDGIVTTAVEAVKFLKGLMEHKLLSAETLSLMKVWATDKNGKPTYGLGLDYAEFNGNVGYGHSGGGIGAGCQLYYFPEKNLYVFIGINLGTVTDSPIHKPAESILNQIYSILLDGQGLP